MYLLQFVTSEKNLRKFITRETRQISENFINSKLHRFVMMMKCKNDET